MPKELTHLIVAAAAKRMFSEKHPRSVLRDHLESREACLLFGSLIHDIAFYAPSTEQGNLVKDRGRLVHGIPLNDTLAPFRCLAAGYDEKKTSDLPALMAGALAHRITDGVFHPFVYHYTGHDLARHFRLETLMDIHVRKRQGRWLEKPVPEKDLYNSLNVERTVLARYLSMFLDLGEDFLPEINRALNLHAFTMRLFRSRAGYHLFRIVSLFKSKEYRGRRHLFYPPGMDFHTPFFDTAMPYRHPVTGESCAASLDTLVETAVARSCAAFESMETALSSKAGNLMPFAESLPPMSLETGLDPSAGKTFRHTDLSLPIDRLVGGHEIQGGSGILNGTNS